MKIIEWKDAELEGWRENPVLAIETLQKFYMINGDMLKKAEYVNRPYTWYNSVASTGVISPADGKSRPQDLALAGLPLPEARGAIMDFLGLQYGWVQSDAILGGAEILRSESDVKWQISIEAFIEYRQKVLGMERRQPIKVVLTRKAKKTGDKKFDLTHPMFHTGDQVIVFTSEFGKQAIGEQTDEIGARGGQPPNNLRVYSLGKESVEDYREMMRILRKDWNVRLLDVQGGGDIAGQMLWHKLLDEHRYTDSPVILGMYTPEGRQRPYMWGKTSFPIDTAPLTTLIQEGVSGEHHLFRKAIHYRH